MLYVDLRPRLSALQLRLVARGEGDCSVLRCVDVELH